MKFSCKTSSLLSAVQLTSRAIGGEQMLPILQNVLMVVSGNRCTLSATNLELSIVMSFDATIESEGTITVPAKALLNFVQYNQDEEVVLEAAEGTQLKLKSKRAKAMISGESASAYPVITSITKQATFSLPADPLLRALNLVTFACAKTTSRPVISGVFMKVEQGAITLVGTDSYRLSEYKMSVEGIEQEMSCIIPAKFLEELKVVIAGRKMTDGAENKEKKEKKISETDVISINVSQQQIEATVGHVQLTSRLIDGKFPDYIQVLPKVKNTTCHISVKELLSAVKRMHYFAKEVNNNITFSITPEVMHLSTKQTQMGKDESDLAAMVQGTENKIAISSHYLIDFLSRIDSDSLDMELSDKMHPAVFRLPTEQQYLHLIMPLRMADE
ncbi:MAG: DNA polymerase III subunit beta [Candidatus Peribacteraceae bacterium]|nr:DNA polymerase III subunit beta [Candidatus Peribacteraceae bacterium]